MMERTIATVPAEPFSTLWLIGLSWGVVAGTVTAGLAISAALVFTQGIAFASLLGGLIVFVIATFYALLGAVLLSIVPIGPAAAFFAWPLYRAGVRAPWAYALAGAAAAITAPALIVAIGNPPWINTFDPLAVRTEPSTVVVFVWFALAGAFGGFMAGRVIRRDERRA
jgi:hypothetical protein